MTTDYRQPDEREHAPNETIPSGPLPLADASGYEAWFRELKRIAKDELGWTKRALASIETTKSAMREYYDEGLTPDEAWEEEYSAGS